MKVSRARQVAALFGFMFGSVVLPDCAGGAPNTAGPPAPQPTSTMQLTAAPSPSPTPTPNSTATPVPTSRGAAIATMPLISTGLPVFTNTYLYSDPGFEGYSGSVRISVPGWEAYDVSSLPVANRGKVMVAWFDGVTYDYDHAIVNSVGYNNLGSYTVEANKAPGGTAAAPMSGWVTLASANDNTKHSRQHLVNLAGYNWVRLNVSVSDGSAGNEDAYFRFDLHDANRGAIDDWIFFGDSITANTMGQDTAGDGSVGNLSQLINAANPAYFPAMEAGGIGGVKAATGAKYIKAWLALFPGHFVGLNYGTNDANGAACDAPTLDAFYASYQTMVKAVIAAGKVPVVPTIPWGRTSNIQACGPSYNDEIARLYAAYPSIVHGPDLWTYFENNQNLISSDGIHPSDDGNGAYRQQWKATLLKAVY